MSENGKTGAREKTSFDVTLRAFLIVIAFLITLVIISLIQMYWQGGFLVGGFIVLYWCVLAVLIYIAGFICFVLTYKRLHDGASKSIRIIVSTSLFTLILAVLSYFSFALLGTTNTIAEFFSLIGILFAFIALLCMVTTQLIMFIYGLKKATADARKRWLLIASFIPVIGVVVYFSKMHNS